MNKVFGALLLVEKKQLFSVIKLNLCTFLLVNKKTHSSLLIIIAKQIQIFVWNSLKIVLFQKLLFSNLKFIFKDCSLDTSHDHTNSTLTVQKKTLVFCFE